MKKKVFITLIALFMIGITVFLIDILNKGESMYINTYSITEKENSLLDLIKGYDDSNYKIFEAALDNKAKSMQIKFYTLHPDGKWLQTGKAVADINHSLLIAFADFTADGELNLAYGNEKKISYLDLNFNPYINNAFGDMKISVNEKSHIEYGKEIPILIQGFTKEMSNKKNFDINNFYLTDVFKQYERVNAITITFYDQEIYEEQMEEQEILLDVNTEKLSEESGLITLIFKNNSDKEYIYGNDMFLQNYTNGKWVKVEQLEEATWDSTGYILPSRGNSELDINMNSYYMPLKKGRYRIAKKLINNGKESIVIDEFLIE